ncbi:MAG: hypothetical protein ACE5ES_05560 [Candidatus Nanoarchaeia archaeon]
MITKVWNFLWNGESLASYVSFVIVSFVLLKFLFYPLFLYVFGLEDIVSVLSGSMLHDGYYPQWYIENGFSQERVESWPFQNGLYVGDAVVIVPAEDVEVGDVIVFLAPDGRQIIHRVTNITESGITTHGDANPGTLDFEKNISPSRIIGEAKFRIPFIGIPRMIMNRLTGL